MKILKVLFALIGLAGLIAAGIYLAQVLFDMQNIMGAANSGRSQQMPSPMNKIYITSGLAGLGGLLLGLGLGLPSRLAGGIRKEALRDAATKRETEIRSRAASRPADEVVVETKDNA